MPAAHSIILFKSVSHAMHAEKLLKTAGIEIKLIPIPRHLSSDCGVCLRFETGARPAVEHALANRVDFDRIVDI
jgi:hypothetical protein